ncbi:hypothetical protein K437DRAFT_276951 [Tilletiaria anomala UBC 951]|uniref:MFS general substrate transporter n=1 Tax=Tilletiaria anomala (strain ATCC 24038 / CBS 436.72 / UBC 951) TaxID=1037660 RepID=A0A066VAT2_TILAU|nr:uncharacterized protein K437DRAFT_276951 [Tilletiaria anomala UBC 951]KDN35715.1 hypothetical protein K437DRAFT_276951 [Tilletiaria anomala UBC 951]
MESTSSGRRRNVVDCHLDGDQQVWSEARKPKSLLISCLAAFVPDFSPRVGIAGLFGYVEAFETTPDRIVNLTFCDSSMSILFSNEDLLTARMQRVPSWSILLLGLFGPLWVILIRCYGRVPILFYWQLFGFTWQIDCATSTTPNTFAAIRCLQAAFSTTRQVASMNIVSHMFLRSIQYAPLWPLGHLCAGKSWRWEYSIGIGHCLCVVVLVAFLKGESTYDRHHRHRSSDFVANRVQKVIGIEGWKYMTQRTRLTDADQYDRADIVSVELRQLTLTLYLSHVVAYLGKFTPRYLHQLSMWAVRRNRGALESEDVLLPTLPGIPSDMSGSASLAIYRTPGERRGWYLWLGHGGHWHHMLLRRPVVQWPQLSRPSGQDQRFYVIFGFAAPCFQSIWAAQSGALVVVGTEAGICAALWLLVVTTIFFVCKAIRERFCLPRRVLQSDMARA